MPSASPVKRAAVVLHGRPEALGSGLGRREAVAQAKGVELVVVDAAGTLTEFGQLAPIAAIVPVAHGAAMAVVRDGLETPGPHPAPGLLLHGVPGRQIVGEHPPRTARAHEPAQAVRLVAESSDRRSRTFSRTLR